MDMYLRIRSAQGNSTNLSSRIISRQIELGLSWLNGMLHIEKTRAFILGLPGSWMQLKSPMGANDVLISILYSVVLGGGRYRNGSSVLVVDALQGIYRQRMWLLPLNRILKLS